MNAIAAAQALTVARANIWDVFAIRGLEHACFGRDAYDFFALLELLISPKVMRLKAIHNGRMVGFVAGELNRREKHGWIVTLGVQPNCEGQGIGTRLLLDCEQLMAQPLIKLTVRKSNTRAIALYEHHGYTFVHTIARYYNDGEDGLLMEKRMEIGD
jgi:ribosomal protein S18 acetylase RimI-like enzyme